jgi:nucleotide-binding universal stress UspA family protein
MKTLAPIWTGESVAGPVAGSPGKRLIMVVGYDGSLPARRALDQAADVLRDRNGALEVVFVAHPPVSATFSAAAVAEVRQGLDEEAGTLAEEVRGRLADRSCPWHFQRRDGAVASELKAVASELHSRYGETAEIVIVIGGSAHWYHHIAGSVALSVVRADAFPALVVP